MKVKKCITVVAAVGLLLSSAFALLTKIELNEEQIRSGKETLNEAPEWLCIDGISNTAWKISEGNCEGFLECNLNDRNISTVSISYYLSQNAFIEIYIDCGTGYEAVTGGYITGIGDGKCNIHIPDYQQYAKSLVIHLKGTPESIKNSKIYEIELTERAFTTDFIKFNTDCKYNDQNEFIFSFDSEKNVNLIKISKNIINNFSEIFYKTDNGWNRLDSGQFFYEDEPYWNRYRLSSDIFTAEIKIISKDSILEINKNDIEFWGNGKNKSSSFILYGSKSDDKDYRFYTLNNIDVNDYQIEITIREINAECINTIFNGINVKLNKVSEINGKKLFRGLLKKEDFINRKQTQYLSIPYGSKIQKVRVYEYLTDGRILTSDNLSDGFICTGSATENYRIDFATPYSIEKLYLYSDDLSGITVYKHLDGKEEELSVCEEAERGVVEFDGSLADSITINGKADLYEIGLYGSPVNELSKPKIISTIVEPELLKSDEYLVSGSLESDTNRCFINGREVAVHNGKYSETLQITNGYQRIDIVEYDTLLTEKVKEETKAVYVYKDEPVIKVNSPMYSVITKEDELEINGNIGNCEDGVLLINGQKVDIVNNHFDFNIVLREGNQNLRFELTDSLGRINQYSLSVEKDSISPEVKLLKPLDNSIIKSGILSIDATVSEKNIWWKTDFNSDWIFCEGNHIEDTILIEDGFYNVHIYVKDKAGNIGISKDISFCADTTPPELFKIESDIEGWSNKTERTINFETTDVTSGISHYELKVDDSMYETVVSPYVLKNIPDGIHNIYVKAFDKAGNSTIAQKEIKVDTSSPSAPRNISLIPGNNNMEIQWDYIDDDEGYQKIYIERNPDFENKRVVAIEKISEDKTYGNGSYKDMFLETFTEFSYRLYAEDRAGNKSDYTDWVTAKTSIAKTNVKVGCETIVKYENITLMIPAGALPKEVKAILIQEISESSYKTAVKNPLGFYFNISAIIEKNGEEYISEHIDLMDEAVIVCSYDESLIPEGFTTGDVQATWYNDTWGTWQLANLSYAESSDGKITFYTNHFTDFTIQATDGARFDQKIKDSFRLFPKDIASQSDINVSLESGSVSLDFTEKVLSGKNNLDLSLTRSYTYSNAVQDAGSEKDTLKKDGSAVWKIANGWRLSFPYMKWTATGIYVCDPDGQLFSLGQMTLKGDTKTSVVMENHEKSDFTLTLSFNNDKSFNSAEVVSSDGRKVKYDSEGRVEELSDLTETNQIKFDYKNNIITDTYGRTITYTKVNNLIKSISFEDLSVSYTTDSKNNLIKAEDILKREWNYEYLEKEIYSTSGSNASSVVNVSLLKNAYGPGYGSQSVDYRAIQREMEITKKDENNKDVKYNISYTDIIAQKVYFYEENDLVDFLDYKIFNFNKQPDEISSYFVKSVTVSDSRSRDEYEYEHETRERTKLTSYAEYPRSYMMMLKAEFKDTSVDTREKVVIKTIHKHYTNTDETVYTITSELDPSSLYVTKNRIEYNSKNYIVNNYKYDSWGNCTNSEETAYKDGVLLTYISKSKTYYLNNSEDEIRHSVKNFPSRIQMRNSESWGHNLPATEVITTAVDSSMLTKKAQQKVYAYTNSGLIDIEAEAIDDRTWCYTEYQYDEFGEITGITKSNNNNTEKICQSFVEEGTLGGNYIKKAITHGVKFYSDSKLEDIDDVDVIYEYDKYHENIISARDANRNETLYRYDAADRITKIIYPLNSNGDRPEVTVVYDDKAYMVTVTDERGVKTFNKYNNIGQLLWSETDSIKTEYEYDNYGQVTAIYGPYKNMKEARDKYITQYVYDNQGRVVLVKHPGSTKYEKRTYENAVNRVTYENECGNKVRKTYDYNGNVIKDEIYTDTGWIATEYKYDALGKIHRKIEPNGNSVNWYYDNRGNLSSIDGWFDTFYNDNEEDMAFSYKQFKYRFDGALTGTVTGGGNTRISTDFELNNLGQILSKRTRLSDDVKGRAIRTYYVYDKVGNILEENQHFSDEAPGDNSIKYTYDGYGNVLSVTNPNKFKTTYTYDISGNKTSISDSRSLNKIYKGTYKTNLAYDKLGRLSKVASPKSAGQTDPITVTYSYDSHGNCISELSSNGTKVINEYDLCDRLISSKTLADGKQINKSVTYDEAGRVISENNAGVIVNTVYDIAGRVSKRGNDETGYYSYSYDKMGNVTSITDKKGKNTKITYNFLNKPISVINQKGIETKFLYTPLGQLARKIDGEGNTTTYSYDKIGRLVKVEDGNNGIETYEYDAFNNITKYIDRKGTVFNRFYNANNLITNEIAVSKDGKTKEEFGWSYDEAGNVKKITSPGSTIVYNTKNDIYESDPFALIKSRSVNGKTVEYGYNTNLHLNSIKTPDGKTTSYTLNNLGEVTAVTDWTKKISYESDSSRVKAILMANGVNLTYKYDSQKRLSEMKYAKASAIIKKYEFSYDNEYNITKINNSGYSYDDLNRLIESVDNEGLHDYESSEMQFDYGLCENDYECDKDAEEVITGKEAVYFDTGARSIICDFGTDYKFNKIELVPQKTNSTYERSLNARDISVYIKKTKSGKWTRLTSDEYTVTKNKANKIVTVTLKKFMSARYVKVNNIYDDRDINDKVTDVYANFSNAGNKILRIKTLSSYLAESFEYDKNGNRTKYTKGPKSYNITYYKNSSGGNTPKVKNDGRFEYTYDANGNRISKRNSEESWRYYWDLHNRLVKVTRSDGEVIEYTYDGENQKISKKLTDDGIQTVQSYAYTPDGKLIWNTTKKGENRSYVYLNGSLLGYNAENTKYYTVTDYHGSVVQVLDSTGSCVWSASYSAYGKITKDDSGFDFEGLYTGQEIDEDTGLTYHWNRWRNEEGDAFISEDPVMDGDNWYGYAGCNPVMYVDPNGLKQKLRHPCGKCSGSYTEHLGHGGSENDFVDSNSSKKDNKSNADSNKNSKSAKERAAERRDRRDRDRKTNSNLSGEKAPENLSEYNFLTDFKAATNLDFGRDYLYSARNSWNNGNYFSWINLELSATCEIIYDGLLAYGCAQIVSIFISTPICSSNRVESWLQPNGKPNYPPNNGAVFGTEINQVLEVGTKIRRYGEIGPNSKFVTDITSSASELSLPPWTNPSIYQEFTVVRCINNVIKAEVGAWAESVGGGTQYLLPQPIKKLTQEGFIK